jgi:hypothetical protein
MVGCAGLAPNVVLPSNAPLTPADCDWPDSSALAFAGWATLAQLNASQLGDPSDRVFAIVTRDPVDTNQHDGFVAHSRALCARLRDGSIGQIIIADDWTLRGQALVLEWR